ncbi:hypothetical protein GDO78_023263, partial [Eleutherodactylus coqui]
MAVAVFLVYQTITDFRDKLKHPVMSVSYKEVDLYEAPGEQRKHALIVKGPRDVRRRELVFLQFHLNETEQDFSAIDYLLFSSYQNLMASTDKTRFMQDCESSFSSWKFSGGFRTWVKMSLVKTTEEDGSQSVEFRQE